MSSWIVAESRPLTQAEMENNVSIIWGFFRARGWTANAVAGMLGNMEAESTINPGRWQDDIVGRLELGFGLVQWTPATKFRDWVDSRYNNADYTNGDYQIERIYWELVNGTQYMPSSEYPETFKEWSVSTKAPGYLAEAFLVNYEMPGNTSATIKKWRARSAELWYTFITGLPAPKHYDLPIWLLFKFKKGVY